MRTIAVIVAVIIVGLVGFAVTRPRNFRVQRSARINAPPARIFPLINDFHQWAAWSPFERLDPAITRTFSGAPIGHGAIYEWAGNRKVGAGRMEIIESTAPNRVATRLDFIRPMEARNVAEFTLRQHGEATDVTWAIFGPSPFAARMMGMFFNMNKLLGRDFERGLANLKALVEG